MSFVSPVHFMLLCNVLRGSDRFAPTAVLPSIARRRLGRTSIGACAPFAARGSPGPSGGPVRRRSQAIAMDTRRSPRFEFADRGAGRVHYLERDFS